MEKGTYVKLIRNSKEDILNKSLSDISYDGKVDLLQNLIKRRGVIFLSLKFYLVLLVLDAICVLILYASIFRSNNTPESLFVLIFCFFAFFCPVYLVISCIEEYIKIRKAYKESNINHKKMKNYIEISIKLQEEEFYKALNQEKCSDLSKIIYEHLAIDMNLDAGMSDRVAESVRKNLERFIFRDQNPKKISKYYDLIKRE